MFKLFRYGYILAIHVMAPLILWVLYRRQPGKPGFGARYVEHLGCVAPLNSHQRPLWIHAVSVGETLSLLPLIKALKQSDPLRPILLTTTTATGAALAANWGDWVEHRYAPLDFPWAVERFLTQLQPCELWIMETELWPNWLAACAARNIPVTVLNARLSVQAAARYAYIKPFFQRFTAPIQRFCCQDDSDAARFLHLGIDADRLGVTGSLKYDLTIDGATHHAGQALRAHCQGGHAGRRIWIAASTHDGEDALFLAAHQRVQITYPDALLMLVPRHPQRFDAVYALCLAYGETVRRSTQALPTASTAIYLGDTMGDLLTLFAAADIAVVGGSFIPHGGLNVLEPAALAKPIIIGPHYFNFQMITDQLLAVGGALQSPVDSVALSQLLIQWMHDQAQQVECGLRAQAWVEKNRGALHRTLVMCGIEPAKQH